ncbi:MAG TPA: DinB family protein [Vicinamibacteria bacterium]|nr:DinB family protein [Vicinamibacteria bacterium]
MIEPGKWMERSWKFDLPVSYYPNLLERVRGTPTRAASLVARVPERALEIRTGTSWSAKEHIAHLDDLHELDETRLREFLSGAEVLTGADMTNSRTETAGHNETSIIEILERFASHREELVLELEPLSEKAILTSSLHPRLRQKIRLIDWVFFVAEHDDHHLVRARRAIVSDARPTR